MKVRTLTSEREVQGSDAMILPPWNAAVPSDFCGKRAVEYDSLLAFVVPFCLPSLASQISRSLPMMVFPLHVLSLGFSFGQFCMLITRMGVALAPPREHPGGLGHNCLCASLRAHRLLCAAVDGRRLRLCRARLARGIAAANAANCMFASYAVQAPVSAVSALAVCVAMLVESASHSSDREAKSGLHTGEASAWRRREHIGGCYSSGAASQGARTSCGSLGRCCSRSRGMRARHVAGGGRQDRCALLLGRVRHLPVGGLLVGHARQGAQRGRLFCPDARRLARHAGGVSRAASPSLRRDRRPLQRNDKGLQGRLRGRGLAVFRLFSARTRPRPCSASSQTRPPSTSRRWWAPSPSAALPPRSFARPASSVWHPAAATRSRRRPSGSREMSDSPVGAACSKEEWV